MVKRIQGVLAAGPQLGCSRVLHLTQTFARVKIDELVNSRPGGHRRDEDPIASVVGEIVPTGDFYDYEAKYVSDDAELRIPAQMTRQQPKCNSSRSVHFARLALAGARVDFFVNHDDGSVLLNEITIPGFTPISMYPKLGGIGIPYAELIDKLIDFAIARHVDKLDTSYSR